MKCKRDDGKRARPYSDDREKISRCMSSLNSDNGFLVLPQFTIHLNKHLGDVEEIKKLKTRISRK